MARKSLLLWNRVLARCFEALSRVRAIAWPMVALAAVLGYIRRGEIEGWVSSDPNRVTIVVLGLLLLLVLLGSHQAERELEKLRLVSISLRDARFQKPVPKPLTVSVVARFRNDSVEGYKVAFPRLVLLWRHGRGDGWKSRPIADFFAAGSRLWEHEPEKMRWGPFSLLDIPARDAFDYKLTFAAPAQTKMDFLRGFFAPRRKLRLRFDVIGHPEIVAEIDLGPYLAPITREAP